MHYAIEALDRALAADGEDVILRRVVGSGDTAINVDVRCRARVDRVESAANAEGPKAQVFTLIMSPTQINEAQWPGGHVPALPPFDVDQRIPRENGPDKILMRGANPRTVTLSDPKIIDGELVRLNLRVTG